jgi:hypothetical protein
MYQEVGLKPEAEAFLSENVEMIPNEDNKCPNCGHILSHKRNSVTYEKHDSFYGDGPSLQEYTLKDGTKVKEIVQAERWSSGPTAFFCLEKEDGTRMFEWTEEEINSNL